jgi:hypothetical protein
MIRTARLWPLPGLVAARLGTPKGSAVAIPTYAPNFAPNDAVDRINSSPWPAISCSGSSGRAF